VGCHQLCVRQDGWRLVLGEEGPTSRVTTCTVPCDTVPCTHHSLCLHLQVFLLHVVMSPCCRELLGSPSTAAPCGSVNHPALRTVLVGGGLPSRYVAHACWACSPPHTVLCCMLYVCGVVVAYGCLVMPSQQADGGRRLRSACLPIQCQHTCWAVGRSRVCAVCAPASRLHACT